MLTPSFEALDCLQTLIERLQDHIDELLIVRLQLDPKVLDIGSDLSVLLNKLIATFLVIIDIFLFFFLAFDDFFYFKMG